MLVAVAKERREGETRVAMVPELVGRLSALGYDVHLEPGAGLDALHPDEAYAAAGATLDPDPMATADVVLSVQPLSSRQLRGLPQGAATISFLPPAQSLDEVVERRDLGITSFAMELVPRISRAQSMD
ncbi:MAG: NAD(P)(+) transhydrogenase (Re/Si-specific) subunit alpha, partial [Nocardioidaceae bacterium]